MGMPLRRILKTIGHGIWIEPPDGFPKGIGPLTIRDLYQRSLIMVDGRHLPGIIIYKLTWKGWKKLRELENAKTTPSNSE
jgi:hypothetical protein